MQDEKLLKKIKRDPERGMAALISRYSGIVYAAVRGRLWSGAFTQADADECVADTFSEFYLSLESYDASRCSLKTWLCRIARNNALDLLRKRKLREGDISLDDPARSVPEEGIPPEDIVIERADRSRVLEAVLSLGDKDKQIIIRKYYLGQSSKAIAEKLGMTVSNVDTRAHRAIAKIKERIGGE